MNMAAPGQSRSPGEDGFPPVTGSEPIGSKKGLEGGLEGALARRFLTDAQGGLVGHPIVATLTLIFFGSFVDPLMAGVWYALVLLATLARFLCSRSARKDQRDPTEVRRLLFYGVSAVAAAWAFGGLLFGSQLPEAELGILLMIMAGLVAAGTITLVAHGPSFYTFSSLLLGSVAAAVFLRGLTRSHILILALVVAFWAIMALLHVRSFSQLIQSLQTRFELARAREEYKSLVESARDLVWRVDNQGRWSFLNPASEEIYGVPAEELLGEVALDRAHEDHREADYAAFARVLMGGELVDHETVHQTLEGGSRNLSFSARPLRGPTGEIQGAVGTARDVTDRARTRATLEELVQKNSLVHSLINTTADLIFYKDEMGFYQGCNLAFSEFIGRSEEEIIGLNDADIVGEERATLYAESDREAFFGTDPVRMEEWVEVTGRGRRLMETVKTSYQTDEGERLGVLGIVRDVTERKEVEDRMRELAEKAEHATRMKSAFLANMSHEIRTPMNGILGMTEIILDSELSSDQRQSLEVVRNSGEALLEVLNDVLDLSKIEAGHLELEMISFDLHEVVAGATQLFSIPASARGNELALDIRPEVPRGVKGDSTRLRQVLSNLVGNAVKFTKEGEILVSAWVEENPKKGDSVCFFVKDNGVGIEESKQSRIFQEFTQADSSTTREFGGTGLGLTISRHLVALMGGELGLSSRTGEGSEFHFSIPLRPDPDFRSVDSKLRPGALEGERVLIVDDNETNRRIFREFLEGAGALVQTAPSAEEGLKILLDSAEKGNPILIALLDVVMPGRDGFQLAEDIRKEEALADLRLMILTSTSRPGDRRQARLLGVGSFLVKPVSRDNLFSGVAATLSGEGPEGVANAARAEEGGDSPPPKQEKKAEATPSSRTTEFPRKILLAEDNPVNQQVAVALLERWGHTVTVAATGLEALEILEEEAFDLVLMDVQMPEMDGLETTRRIRRHPRISTLPIIALTAHALREERDKCTTAGMDDYLSKPFRPEDLQAKVELWGGKKVEEVENGSGGGNPPVLMDLFREAMREAGIESVVESAVSIYLSEIPIRMAALEKAVTDGDPVKVEQEAHALKSGSRNIRADVFGDLLDVMERAGDEGNLALAVELLPGVLKEFESVRDYLNEMGFQAE
jgi:two-component system sensor histidine kinase/response regulator